MARIKSRLLSLLLIGCIVAVVLLSFLQFVPSVYAVTTTFSAVNLTSVHTCPLDTRTFVVVYHDEDNDDFSFQIYDTNGTQVLAETDVDDTSGGSVFYTSIGVSAFNSTTFVIGWFDNTADEVYMAVYNTAGTLLSGPTYVAGVGTTGKSVQVSCFNSTHFVIGFCTTTTHKFGVYDSSFNVIIADVAVDATTGASVSVSAFNSTTFVYGWFDVTGQDATFSVYDVNGTLLIGPIDADDTVSAGSYSVSVSTLNSTYFVIGWIDGADDDATFAVYNSNGTNIVAATDADQAVFTSTSCQVSALNSTVFVISWYDDSSYDLHFSTFLSNGANIVGGVAGVDIEAWSLGSQSPHLYQSPCGLQSGTGIGLYNDNWIIAYANTSTQAIWQAFMPNGTAWDGIVPIINNAPTIGAVSGTNWDDIDNLYAQKKTYTVSVTYTDTDGFADIDFCELYLKTGGNVTRAEFQFDEDGNSWSTPAGSTEWTLIGYSNASAGNNIAVVWGFQPQWDATEENALDFLFFVNDTAGASVNSLSGTPFDVVTRLVTESFANDDGRINIAGTTTISGNVYYANNPGSDTASGSYPPDVEFTSVSIHNSTHTSQATDNVIVNGAFSVSFAIPGSVQSNTYHVYINLADADGTDQDALDGDTTAVVGDRVKVYYFQSNDTRTNVNEYVNITVKAELEFDAHALGAGDSLSFNTTTLIWNGASFYNDSQTQAATGNWTFAMDGATEATFTITAYTTNVTLPWVVWDNLTATNLQPVQYQGTGTYKYDVRLTYGFDGTAIVGGYMALEYPNGTKAGECVTNATGYAGFILDQLNATNGVLKLYGLNETAYGVTTAGVNLTFTIRLWTLVPQDVSGNSLTNTNHNMTLGATAVWNGTATAVYVPPDTFNLTVTWLQNLSVNSTLNVAIVADTTTDLNCTCYPYVIGVTRYWAASNGTITSGVYGSYLLTVKFSCALDSYVLVASYTTRPSYVLNVTYNMTIVFASGYLVMPHFGNATIVVSYENWAGLYVKYTDRTMWSAGWAGQRLDIVLNGTIGDSGELDVNCGSKGMPVSDLGFTFTSYVGGVFTGLYTFTATSATVSLEWTLATGLGGITGETPDLFITLAFSFPKNVQSGTTVDGFLNVSWMGAATVYIWSVVVESDYASDWELQISRLPWTLETLMQDGRTQVPVVLYITGTLAAGNYSVPCDVTFHTVEGVSKTVRSIITFEVTTPIAEVPSTLVYVFLLGLGVVVTSGLFLGTQKRRKYSQ